MATFVQPEGLRVELPLEQLAEFCQRWKIVRLEIFGSALRDDFSAQSDLDFLVTYAGDAHWGLFGHARIERELSELLGRNVDLMTRRAIEGSQNWVRRQSILSSARDLYVA